MREDNGDNQRFHTFSINSSRQIRRRRIPTQTRCLRHSRDHHWFVSVGANTEVSQHHSLFAIVGRAHLHLTDFSLTR
jgi:hypothetical protein